MYLQIGHMLGRITGSGACPLMSAVPPTDADSIIRNFDGIVIQGSYPRDALLVCDFCEVFAY